jgi:hypothetical protein
MPIDDSPAAINDSTAVSDEPFAPHKLRQAEHLHKKEDGHR